MSRVAAALITSWLSLCVLNGGTGIAAATQGARNAQLVVAGNEIKEVTKDAGAHSETNKAVEKPVRQPARQVPVEPFDEPANNESAKEPEKSAADEAEKKAADKSSEGMVEKSVEKAPETSIRAPAARAVENKPVKPTRESVKDDASANEAQMSGPGLPIRKPRKPVFRKKTDIKQAKKKPAPPSSARDKKLCKALQDCRNAFVKCKSKIKHPDQSEPWIIAKEVCGGHYKTCVEKDFQDGEWFMTRWFYFQELNCGE